VQFNYDVSQTWGSSIGRIYHKISQLRLECLVLVKCLEVRKSFVWKLETSKFFLYFFWSSVDPSSKLVMIILPKATRRPAIF
jgi:hypothetical protein